MTILSSLSVKVCNTSVRRTQTYLNDSYEFPGSSTDEIEHWTRRDEWRWIGGGEKRTFNFLHCYLSLKELYLLKTLSSLVTRQKRRDLFNLIFA